MNFRLKYLCWVNGAVLFAGLFFLLKLGYRGCISVETRFANVETVEYSHERSARSMLKYYTPRKDQVTLSKMIFQQTAKPKRQRLPNPLLSLENIIKSLQEQFSLNVEKFKGEKWKKQEFNHKGMEYREPDCAKRQPYLLIEVHTKPSNFLARQAIRMAWGKHTNAINELHHDKRYTWETVFLVGKSKNDRINGLMLMEARQHNDLIIGNFLDTYRNLTYKTLLTIEYPLKHCHNAQYIMKTDDDCYINVKSVMQWLKVRQQKSSHVEQLYMGRIHWDNKPSRGNTSKYFVTEEEYKGDVYPPYAAGGGYVFTGSLLPKLLQASNSTAVFPMEDAYFGLLIQNIGIKATNHNLVMPYTFCDCKLNKCQSWYDDSLCNIAVAMVIHDVRPDEQIPTHINVMVVNSVPSICKHERGRESWDEKTCVFS